MTIPNLSICIVSWNTLELLRQCLLSIQGCADDADVEVIVVDNASTDGSAEMVRLEFPAVRLFANDANSGFAAGCNTAVRSSTGRYILLLNSDTVILPPALHVMMRFLDEHPEAGAVGCRLLNPDGSPQVSYRRFPTLTWRYAISILLSKAHHHIRPLRGMLDTFVRGEGPSHPVAVDWVSGACLMTRREVFEEVGYLDERFFMFCEEIDWCHRVRKASWEIYYVPDAEVIHYSGQSSKQNKLRTYWSVVRSSYEYFRKMRAEGRDL